MTTELLQQQNQLLEKQVESLESQQKQIKATLPDTIRSGQAAIRDFKQRIKTINETLSETQLVSPKGFSKKTKSKHSPQTIRNLRAKRAFYLEEIDQLEIAVKGLQDVLNPPATKKGFAK